MKERVEVRTERVAAVWVSACGPLKCQGWRILLSAIPAVRVVVSVVPREVSEHASPRASVEATSPSEAQGPAEAAVEAEMQQQEEILLRSKKARWVSQDSWGWAVAKRVEVATWHG